MLLPTERPDLGERAVLTLGTLVATLDTAPGAGGVQEGDAGSVGNHWGQGGQVDSLGLQQEC